MRDPGEIAASLPRPGRTLKAILALIAGFAVLGAVVVNWAPGGRAGSEIFRLFAFSPAEVLTRPWGLLTSGVLTAPQGISHALWSLLGLYFLAPDLERRWGGARLVRFLLGAVVMGNLAVLAGSFVPSQHELFHPGLAFGPFAAITAVVVAWARDNAHREIRLMFFLPLSGRTLLWLTVGLAVLSLLFASGAPEGALAPLGGVAAGFLFGGTPSPARALWLRVKLALLRRKGGGVTVESILQAPRGKPAKRPSASAGGKAPSLRVVRGGLEDELAKRKPPKDKRFLN